MRANDIFAGMLLVTISLYGIYLALQFPDFGGIGPAFFPLVLLVILSGCGLALIISGWRKLSWAPIAELDPWARTPKGLGALILIPGAILLYIAAARTLGFLLVAPILMFAALFWGHGGRRVLISGLIAILFPIAIYWIFAVMLRVPLPRGTLTGLTMF